MTPSPHEEPLTPIAFLRRAEAVYAERTAVVDGADRFSYRELADRARRLAGLLAAAEVRPGDRVSVLAPNRRMALEAHYGVPMAGAVLNALNIRLSVPELGWIVEHAGSRVLLADRTLEDVAGKVAEQVPGLRVIGEDAYEAGLAAAAPLDRATADEMSMISLNYTSGTTGRPKGVMYHHRGAYLQALAMAFHNRLGQETVHLWTLPMFHCNGWCFTWAVTAAGGTHVCLPKIDHAVIWRLLREEGVTSLNAAPTVLTDMAAHPEAGPLARGIHVGTGGAPPSPSLLARLAELNMTVTHLYGLTETFGPAVIRERRPEWADAAAEDVAMLVARQGDCNVAGVPIRVLDRDDRDVPPDGTTMGEVALRGNNVTLGYFRDPEGTAATYRDGWFRTGDLGVRHRDGSVELRDRLKDIIISGGENIAGIEVEQVLDRHPAVLEAAVVGRPDPRWGEVPVAYVTLREGAAATQTEIIEFAREQLARFKVPREIVFGPLPKTATGKIQKYLLRR